MPWYAYPALAFRGRKYLPDRSATNVFDVIVVSGDAYVDHPAFPAAVITRLLQRLGLKVAVIAQPDWNSDSDFLVWGRPELFFAVVPGAMDSMVANYTASRMPRGRDRLSPDGEPGLRPKRALQIYVQKIRQLFRDAGLVIGGIEASLRRFAHYDFWEDRLRDPILVDTPADILVYGMAEPVIEKVVDWYKAGRQPAIPQIPQTAMRVKHDSWREWLTENFLLLPSVDECRQNAEAFMNMTRITDSSVRPGGKSLVQQHPKGDIICFPPSAADYLAETTIIGQLPYNRRSHPIYENPVPGLEPVQFSVQSHRGCLGACSFCALSLHQGRTIRSRTPASILAELASFAEHPDFKGIVPDIGGPAVNMYGWECRAGGCERNMCTHPVVCRNVLTTLRPLAELLKAAVAVPGIRRVFLGSGLRYDLIRPEEWDLFEYIIFNHISGQLKVAPEHFDKKVLGLMRKGENADFAAFARKFYASCERAGKRLFLVPYLMTAFPGSGDADQLLARMINELHLAHEQLQEFTPTPGSMGTAMFYTGLDQHGNQIKVARKHSERMQGRNQIQGGRPPARQAPEDRPRRSPPPHKKARR
ncbi:MAG TPA: YgiQ family radical SAM protein [Candidatus Rifleibacterium sp.]|nr:YgiQ family radical SAM protein [Candidatus Rifleibacterium sp.]